MASGGMLHVTRSMLHAACCTQRCHCCERARHRVMLPRGVATVAEGRRTPPLQRRNYKCTRRLFGVLGAVITGAVANAAVSAAQPLHTTPPPCLHHPLRTRSAMPRPAGGRRCPAGCTAGSACVTGVLGVLCAYWRWLHGAYCTAPAHLKSQRRPELSRHSADASATTDPHWPRYAARQRRALAPAPCGRQAVLSQCGAALRRCAATRHGRASGRAHAQNQTPARARTHARTRWAHNPWRRRIHGGTLEMANLL